MSETAYQGRRSEAGYTLLELMVASLLASTFALAVSSASSVYFNLLNDFRKRSETALAVNVIRARMIADFKSASAATCSDGTTLLLTLDNGGILSQVEYTTSGGKLLRWYSASDRTLALSDHVNGLRCTGLGERGLELELAMGEETDPSSLYVHLAEKPPEGEGT